MGVRARRFSWLAVVGACLLTAMPCVVRADALPAPLPPERAEAASAAPSIPANVESNGERSYPATWPWLTLVWGIEFLLPLLFTLLIEVPIVGVAGRGSPGAWRAGVLVNTVTNPLLVLVVLSVAPRLLLASSETVLMLFVAGIELAVVAVEWRLYRWVLGWSNRRALLTSLLANALSFLLGLPLPLGLSLLGL